jgi:hypothetical protein
MSTTVGTVLPSFLPCGASKNGARISAEGRRSGKHLKVAICPLRASVQSHSGGKENTHNIRVSTVVGGRGVAHESVGLPRRDETKLVRLDTDASLHGVVAATRDSGHAHVGILRQDVAVDGADCEGARGSARGRGEGSW